MKSGWTSLQEKKRLLRENLFTVLGVAFVSVCCCVDTLSPQWTSGNLEKSHLLFHTQTWKNVLMIIKAMHLWGQVKQLHQQLLVKVGGE